MNNRESLCLGATQSFHDEIDRRYREKKYNADKFLFRLNWRSMYDQIFGTKHSITALAARKSLMAKGVKFYG